MYKSASWKCISMNHSEAGDIEIVPLLAFVRFWEYSRIQYKHRPYNLLYCLKRMVSVIIFYLANCWYIISNLKMIITSIYWGFIMWDTVIISCAILLSLLHHTRNKLLLLLNCLSQPRHVASKGLSLNITVDYLSTYVCSIYIVLNMHQ